eukprot:m.52463 g.52463  ORF g.52463 m.52463 type:complete len:94 (-) comp10794_c0_seq1:550-831(-)
MKKKVPVHKETGVKSIPPKVSTPTIVAIINPACLCPPWSAQAPMDNKTSTCKNVANDTVALAYAAGSIAIDPISTLGTTDSSPDASKQSLSTS